MAGYAKPVEVLIDELGRLPGVGPKSAQRIAFHLLKAEETDTQRLADALVDMRQSITFCSKCFNIAEGKPAQASDNETIDLQDSAVLCQICADPARDQMTICVVEEPKDVQAVERTGGYNGLYHVLLGVINPLDGIGPDQLKISELAHRVASEDTKEVVLCTNPNLEGETTAAFIATKVLAPFGIKVTRLASGLPVGGDLEYADELTLGKALEGRSTLI